MSRSSSRSRSQPVAAPVAAIAVLRCAARTAVLLARHRVRQPRTSVGRTLRFADGTSAAVYRETVIERSPPAEPAVLVVVFRLRFVHRPWAHALFRWESELNTVLFAGFPGLVSKLWLRHDEHHRYRGVYQWDGAASAEAYARRLWWVLALVSEPASIEHVVLPGLVRDELLDDPSRLGAVDAMDAVGTPPGTWWRPVAPGPVPVAHHATAPVGG